MRNLGSLNVSERLAAGSSNVYSKTLCYANRQGVTHSVLPVWAGMQIVVDSTSNAQAGQITLTAIQLMSFANLRSGNFKHVSFKTA